MTSTGESVTTLARRIEEFLMEQPRYFVEVVTLTDEGRYRDVLRAWGLARDGILDPVQQAFIDHGGFQCGFCTPGMILAVKALLALHPSPDDAQIRHVMRGNLCRCTGYVKILDAIKSLIPPGGLGEQVLPALKRTT